MAMLPPTPSHPPVGRRLALLVALVVVTAAAVRVEGRRRRGRPRRNADLPGADRATVEGVAAELALRGVDVRVSRSIDLTSDPAAELFTLEYAERHEQRVQRHLANLQLSGVRQSA